jgi:hypothetical protein
MAIMRVDVIYGKSSLYKLQYIYIHTYNPNHMIVTLAILASMHTNHVYTHMTVPDASRCLVSSRTTLSCMYATQHTKVV